MKEPLKRFQLVTGERAVQAVRHWVEEFVVKMNLCPFAGREILDGRVRFSATKANTAEQLLLALHEELETLNADPSIETTLLIHPDVLRDFSEYNQFLSYADSLLVEMQLEGIYQIASFHPDYQFDGTKPDDAENYTNRSPYPILHLLREASVERANADYAGVDQIPERNIALMQKLGSAKLQEILSACLKQ